VKRIKSPDTFLIDIFGNKKKPGKRYFNYKKQYIVITCLKICTPEKGLCPTEKRRISEFFSLRRCFSAGNVPGKGQAFRRENMPAGIMLPIKF